LKSGKLSDKPLKAIIIVSGLLYFIFSNATSGAEPVTLSDKDSSFKVESGIEYMVEESSAKLTYEQVIGNFNSEKWKTYKGKIIKFAHQPHPVWFRFYVINNSQLDKKWILGINWPLLNIIEYYQFNHNLESPPEYYRAGMDCDPESKLLKDPAFMFPVSFSGSNPVLVLLRVSTSSAFILPLTIWDSADYQSRRYGYGLFMGFMFGILSVMFFYNLSLYFFTKDKSYFFYTVYLIAIILYELAVTGYGVLYLWGESHWLKARGYEFFASMSFLTATLFFRQFLDLKNCTAHLNRINLFLAVYWTLAVLLSAFWPSRVLTAGIALIGLGTSLAGIYMSAALIFQGNIFARYFAFAWFTVTFGTIANLLSLFGAYDGNWLTENGQHIGFMIETVLLSVALADRIKRERESRESAQLEALELVKKVDIERREKIAAQEKAIAVQLIANAELESHVLERTQELDQSMKNLEIVNKQLSELSLTDSLTGVFNRRYFDEVFRNEYERSAKSGVPMALFMIDIDNFKVINDVCGHLAGDKCLKLVAVALGTTVGRSNDMIARYGGEEFAMILPGTGFSQAMNLAEQVRKTVEEIQFIYRGKRMTVTISIGVVSRVTSMDQHPDDFIAEADVALYKAKEAGRNRVAPWINH